MAITYVGGQVGGRAGSTSTSNVTFALTGGTNSTPQAGDLVIIGCTVASQARTPACAISGYTTQTQINANGTTYDTSLNMSYKFMGGTPDTTFTLPSTGNIQDAQRYTVQVWRGVDTGTPLDVSVVSSSGTATGRPDPGSITPTTTGAVVGIIGAGAAATGAAYTAPANYTTNFLTGTTADTNDAMIGSGYRSWTSGTEDPAAYTGGTANAVDSWAVFTYALRPGVNNYTLTCTGGAYNLTGGSANINYVGASPQVISTTTLVLGTSATPGAQAITVPADAQVVVVTSRCYSASGADLSLTSNFTGTFTTTQDSNAGTERTTVSHAVVSSTGSKTITPVWTTAPAEGPLFFITFIKNVNTSDYYRASDAIALDSSGSTTSRTVASTANDLVLALESQYDAGQAIPGTVAGWTSISTQGNNSEGGRLSTADSPGASTTTFTGGSTNWDGVAIISIKPNSSGAYTLTAQGGSYALTGASAILKRSKYILASGGSYALTGASAVLQKNLNWKLTAIGGSYSLTGANATLSKSKRIVATGGSYALTGANAIVSRNRNLTATGGSYTLTGSSAVLTWTPGATGYTLTCLGGSYSLTGSSALFSRNRKLTANGGSYQQIGSNATLLRSKRIVSSGGTYTLSGGTATLLRSKRIVASGGSYSLTGQPATILKSKYLLTTGGSYTITGQQATITWTSGPNAYTLICNGGAYTLTGSQASISRNRKLTASGGSYTYTGQSATILRTKYLSASGGSYVINGQAATLKKSYILQAAGGLYQLTGSSAILQKAGGAVWPLPSQVLLGVEYGPTGIEYTGTLNIFGIKYDITTGKLIKPLTEKVVMTL